MCLNPKCVFITIGVDDFGAGYISHYRYNQTKTDLIVLFREFIISKKVNKPKILYQDKKFGNKNNNC